MYPSSSSASASSSSSSSSQHPHSSTSSQTGLTRYGSAPGSLLTSTVDAVIGGSRLLPSGHYFSSGDSSSASCKVDHRSSSSSSSSYDAFDGSALLRQKSSPAGFLAHLASNNHNHNAAAAAAATAGFTITRGGSGSQSHGGGSRLKSELSFTGGGGGGQQECLSRISENGDLDPTTCGWGGGGDNNNNSNSILFSTKPSSTTNDPDLLHCLNALESQFSMPQTSLEMAAVEKMLHIPEDSVPCKIRAKRGCATHPRSIAERERRTRISGKLKKLQDLVPNMDKQTSYADMLDLAVQHIKGLQTQVQKLHTELENCTCGCKQGT